MDDDPRFRIEDQELDSLSLQEQLADRLLKQIVVNLPGYCQVRLRSGSRSSKMSW